MCNSGPSSPYFRVRGKQSDESREEGGEVDIEVGFLTNVDPLADHSVRRFTKIGH